MINQAVAGKGSSISDQINNQAAEKKIKNGRDPTFYRWLCVKDDRRISDSVCGLGYHCFLCDGGAL